MRFAKIKIFFQTSNSKFYYFNIYLDFLTFRDKIFTKQKQNVFRVKFLNFFC